jgi:hypothetical protein
MAEQEDRMSGPIHVNGPFLRLGKSTWVRHDAIVIIRSRNTNTPEGSGSEVVMRNMATHSNNAYVVWTDQTAEQIIAAVIDCADNERD